MNPPVPTRVSLIVEEHHLGGLGGVWLSLSGTTEGQTAASATRHYVRLDQIVSWSHDLGHRRIHVVTPAVLFVLGGKASRATLDEPSRTPAIDSLAAALDEHFLGLSHPWVTARV
jgi:hypothetical protein